MILKFLYKSGRNELFVDDYFIMFLEILPCFTLFISVKRIGKIIPTNFTVHKNYFLSNQKCITSAHFLSTRQRIQSINRFSRIFHHIGGKTSQPSMSMNFTRKKFYAPTLQRAAITSTMNVYFSPALEINVQGKRN